MKLLEIKNNLVKLSYSESETPMLGRFIVLASEEKSYVAQFVNLKSDTVNNFAIAKLLFTFTPDGVVDNYDGSIPGITSELSFLPAEELLNLLPIETAIKIGTLAQQEDLLSLDISVFERNFTVFADNDSHRVTFISNCARQLFRMKEKSVIIDTDNLFEDYPKLEFTKDFKLPLNSKMIDYIFEYELAEVDAATKAVIQDIFYAVQQYIKTLDFEFLPIDNFVDVVANQYKEMQMPELALLKNKLLKYRDANVFANTKEEVFALKEQLEQKNCSIINLKDINEQLQKEVISFVHTTLNGFEKYIYFFVPLTDDNSDKQLLKQMVNHNHIFTTFITNSTYKYAQELKQHAQNMILFAPQVQNHDFGAFNTFLNKLGMEECIVYGKLTQGIPFMVDMSDLELDLTKEDVLGEKYQFIPVAENLQFVQVDEYGNQTPVELSEDEGYASEQEPEDEVVQSIPVIDQPPIEVVEQPLPLVEPTLEVEPLAMEEPVNNIFEETPQMVEEPPVEQEVIEEEEVSEFVETEDFEELSEPEELELEETEVIEEPEIEEFETVEADDVLDFTETTLTENDLDFIEDNGLQPVDDILADTPEIEEADLYEENPYIDEPMPTVPVYPAEEEGSSTDVECEFEQGSQVTHPRYGRGVVEKIIKYGNKTLCSISFENVGRRLLDPTVSELTKL